MWVGYSQQRWTQALAASVRLAWLGFGTDWVRTLQGAWLLLRAIQLWALFPGNDPDGPGPGMRQLYALVKLLYDEPADPGGCRPGGRLVAGCTGSASVRPGKPATSWPSR